MKNQTATTRAAKNTATPRNDGAHRRHGKSSSAPVARALSVCATTFWAVYPVLWACLVCFGISRFLGCTVPVAAVTSGSMEPQTYRGDLLLLVGPDFGGPVRVGDVVLYRLPHRPETPIVHRVVDVVVGSVFPPGNQAGGDARWYLTKGDDNEVDDTGLVVPSFPSGLLPHAALIGNNPLPKISFFSFFPPKNTPIKPWSISALSRYIVRRSTAPTHPTILFFWTCLPCFRVCLCAQWEKT
nr:signal peptidase [Pandoravirus massiliensis]